jgi:probable rRNA maturation factor
MTLAISVQYASTSKHLPVRAQVRRWALAAHRQGDGAGEVTIRYVDEKEGRVLNRDFRGKDYATNVLTFVHDGPPFQSKATPTYSADIVICAPVIAREAREQKKPVAAHHGHMVIHGMLHAQGFDHENDGDAAAMEAIEIAALRRFRIKNPYESD